MALPHISETKPELSSVEAALLVSASKWIDCLLALLASIVSFFNAIPLPAPSRSFRCPSRFQPVAVTLPYLVGILVRPFQSFYPTSACRRQAPLNTWDIQN